MKTINIDLSTQSGDTQEEIRYAYKSEYGMRITDSYRVASSNPSITKVIIIIDKFTGTKKDKELLIKKLFKERHKSNGNTSRNIG